MKTISLNKKLYSRERIEQTADSFKEFCDIEIAERGLYFDVQIEGRSAKSDDIEREFANHCLGMMK